EALCNCGNTVHVLTSQVGGDRRIKSCGCFYQASRSKVCRKFEPVISAARHVWRTTHYNEGCDFDTFYRLSQQPCYYCGAGPTNVANHAKAKARGKVASDYQKENG